MNFDNRKVVGALLFFSSAQFLLILVIAEALYPGYSVSKNYISDLGVGTTAPLFNSSVFVLGVTALAGAYFVHRVFKFKLFSVLVALIGIGAMGVGVFPETIPIPHSISALITFVCGGLSAIVSSKLAERPFSYFCVCLGILSLVALALFTAGTCLGLGVGGMERMVAYPTLMWGIGFGGFLMSHPDT